VSPVNRPDPVGIGQPGDRRYHWLRPGGDHDVLGAVLAVAHRDAAGADDPHGAAQQLDSAAIEPTHLARVVIARDHEVPPFEGRPGIERSAHGLPRARRLASRLERLARTQQGLGGNAGPVVALAAHTFALDDGDPQTALGQLAGAVLPRGAGADDDDVVVRAHYVSSDPGSCVTCPPWVGAVTVTH
jgi:hypothetical protein